MSDMKYKHFTKEERLELSILINKGYSRRDIANALSKNHSSVVRELKRNKVKGRYDPQKANQKARAKRRYSKYQGMKVKETFGLEKYVEEKLKNGWSPELIAGRWRNETGEKLKADTIYKYLYSASGQRLCKYLKYKRHRSRWQKSSRKSNPVSYIPDRISINERPEEISNRTTFGHYEGDTMGRPKNASSQTLVVIRERLSRRLFGIKVKKMKQTIEGFKKLIHDLPISSLTLDNGIENSRYKELGLSVYFCNPYHSWEKGCVEQGIGQIRTYIPKKADLKNYSKQNIDDIIDTLNNRPMKCLDYQTPNEVFSQNISFYSLTKWCT